ncbi:hypothetical protein [Novosphingobium sp. Gsoil 351]|uniref:hypothetical protein n=1 Tax=Novosphingobium sp. Gsoil 351 TaxID=2675225 RepID=UPI0012B448A0|nr:hypothetical protein [Novosphingobium sp. Gsoil 351]QGN54666.1 hypothetical protein GKE62_08980 [Novosphingobium sp. Gsoil 351]
MIGLAAKGRLLGALAALALLSGCIAAAALPLMAGGAMFAGGNVKIRAATPRPKSSGTVRIAPTPEERTAGTAVAALALPSAAPAGLGSTAVLTGLTELPPPTPSAADPWRAFVDYAARQGAGLAGNGRGRSVLLESGTQLVLPKMRTCEGKPPAVIVDLDAGPGRFTPGTAVTPSPGLAEGLARLREAGVVVLWISALPGGEVGQVAEALRSSGLDPEGKDPLLLARSADDRKQVLREDANKDVCVIAIAGDRKGDFDELFDYLRDPRSGDGLDYLLGAGWFIAPPPLG